MTLNFKRVTLLMASFTLLGCSWLERALLFYPTHHSYQNGLSPWIGNEGVVGYCRKVDSPENIWLMLHGNGGQASDRAYAIASFSDRDSVFILEYPGYGNRPGVPSKKAFDLAAQQAYLKLRSDYPHTPVCVAAESIGSGPASSLAHLDHKPDKLVFIVPFNRFSLVAKDHFPAFLVDLFLKTEWDNAAALADFSGSVDIFGAEDDTIVPVKHARALAAAVPSARLTIIGGGHNDWSLGDRVMIRNP